MVMGSFYEESFKYLPIPQKVNKRNGKNVAPLCITFISVNAMPAALKVTIYLSFSVENNVKQQTRWYLVGTYSI